MNTEPGFALKIFYFPTNNLCKSHLPGCLSEDILGAEALLYHQVGGQGGLVRGQAPDPEVVNLKFKSMFLKFYLLGRLK